MLDYVVQLVVCIHVTFLKTVLNQLSYVLIEVASYLNCFFPRKRICQPTTVTEGVSHETHRVQLSTGLPFPDSCERPALFLVVSDSHQRPEGTVGVACVNYECLKIPSLFYRGMFLSFLLFFC